MMAFIQRLARSLRSARSVQLPDDEDAAYSMLMSLVIADRHKTLSELISNSEFDINHKTDRGNNTLLHQAANMGAYECLCVLIKKGADVNAQDTSGNTALHRAAKNGHKKIIVKLLENKADINIQNNEGFTMVHWLAANGRHQVLEEIASLIGNLDIEDTQGQTALHVAAQNGHIPTVEFLLNNKADINKQTSYGWTPLHFAISHGQHDTVKYLLVRGIRLQARVKPVPRIHVLQCTQGVQRLGTTYMPRRHWTFVWRGAIVRL